MVVRGGVGITERVNSPAENLQGKVAWASGIIVLNKKPIKGFNVAASRKGGIMAQKNILVAFDGSDLSVKALEMAIEYARFNPEIHLDVAYVVPIPVLPEIDQEHLADLIEMIAEDGRKILYQAQDLLGDLTERSETLLVKGTDPASELLKLIDVNDYYLVIVGSRGLSGIKGYLGSVSHKVLHNADIPVLIAK
ncbi:MAG: universal stress protein [Raoultibacter sp.]